MQNSSESVVKNKDKDNETSKESLESRNIETDTGSFSRSGRSSSTPAEPRNVTWKAVIEGELSFKKLVEIAIREYNVSSFEAEGIVMDMYNAIRNVNTSGSGVMDGVIDDSLVKNGLFGQGVDFRERLVSPNQDFASMSRRKRKRSIIDLDKQISDSVRGIYASEDILKTSSSSEKEIRDAGDNISECSSSAEDDEDLDDLALQEVQQLNKSLENHGSSSSSSSSGSSSGSSNSSSASSSSSVSDSGLSDSERLAKRVIYRELGLKIGDKECLSDWDPLASVLDGESRKTLVKELESSIKFIRLPGVFPVPLKGKGSSLYNRDNSLYRLMGDMSVIMKASANAIHLCLEGKADQAVVALSKMFVLCAHSISKMNAERLRVHFPREFANKILRARAEPILRKQYRQRAHQVAQEIRDTNLVVKHNSNNSSFLPKGGRGFKPRSQNSQRYRSYQTSFPQNSRFKKFRWQSQPNQKKESLSTPRK
jgi:hypothetical protein